MGFFIFFQQGSCFLPGVMWAKIRQVSLRVQVYNPHLLTQNLFSNCYYPNPMYLIIGCMDPLGYKVSPGFGGPQFRALEVSLSAFGLYGAPFTPKPLNLKSWVLPPPSNSPYPGSF